MMCMRSYSESKRAINQEFKMCKMIERCDSLNCSCCKSNSTLAFILKVKFL